MNEEPAELNSCFSDVPAFSLLLQTFWADGHLGGGELLLHIVYCYFDISIIM